MTLDIIILGIGGNCIDILDAIREVNRARKRTVYRCLGFLDDNPSALGRDICGERVLGPIAAAVEYPRARFINGIGSPKTFLRRPAVVRSTGVPDDHFVSVIHPSASVSRMAQLAPGCAVLQQVTIASNARVGSHVTILPNSIVSHDDVIGDFTAIAGGVCVSGGVVVGHCCYLGTNSSIIGNVTIGDRSLVGMGSVVVGDVASGTVVVGNPARLFRATI